MISSMTGFGRAEKSLDEGTFTVEARSVNHRYTDISVRLPRALANFESFVRELVKSRVQRGSVSVQVSWDRGDEGEKTLSLNDAVIRRYAELFERMSREYGIAGTPDIDTFSRLTDVFCMETPPADEEKLRNVLETVLSEALDSLIGMRTREGQALADDILSRMDLMAGVMDEIVRQAPERLARLEQRLREKVLAAYEGAAEPDTQRLLQEITIYADKWDVSEEEVRFRSHLDAIRQAIEGGGAVGRRLNFLIQELNREVNTVGSKANDAAIAQQVVSLKEELERIREQVENIE